GSWIMMSSFLSVIHGSPITPQIGFVSGSLCATISVSKSDPNQDITGWRRGLMPRLPKRLHSSDRDVRAGCTFWHTGRERWMNELFSFGAWVRQRRRALDLTRDELAAHVGCAATTLRHIEADERRPSKQLAARLADGLQIAPEERPAF